VTFDPERTLTRILRDGDTEVIRHLLSAKSPHNAVPLPYFAFDRIAGEMRARRLHRKHTAPMKMLNKTPVKA
jgi:hypothetical protein